MKFLLLAITIAVALAANEVTAATVTGSFVNTTGKVAGAWCSFAVAVTHATTSLTASTNTHYNIWLVNSATAGTWVINQTIVYVMVSNTVSATPAITASAAAGSIYFASAAVTLASASTDITAASLTASATTFHTVSGTTAGVAFSFNLTKAQFDQMNSTKLIEKAHIHYKYESGTAAVTYVKLYSGDTYVAISAASTPVVIETKTANDVCSKGFVSLASASSQDTFIGSLLALAFF
jgi:hypothetical protein